MTRTYLLQERIAADCRLTGADVEFLFARHRAHVQVQPTAQPGVYRLTPRGYAGTLVAPSCRLLLRPKIPLEQLCFLLDPDHPPSIQPECTEAGAEDGLLDLLALQFVRLLEERLAAGLQRDYVEQAAEGRFLQGKLDVPEQLREAGWRRDRLHSRFDALTADLPCNRMPKAVAERLQHSPLLGEKVRGRLQHCLPALAEVAVVPLDERLLAAAAPDEKTAAYRPLWELCRVLVEGWTAGVGQGGHSAPAFLVDLERVFERYVARQLQAQLPALGVAVTVQPWLTAAPARDGQPDLNMRPDVLLGRDGEPRAVLDTKWKRLPRARLHTSDVYQVLAYCTLLGVRRAFLVYPGRRDRRLTYRLRRSEVTLSVHVLRVHGPVSACLESLRQLAHRLLG
jgi:5-methylcytosine-specific restriction enzyme subunit McrC